MTNIHFTDWMNEGRESLGRNTTKPLKMKNGLVMSVQASKSHYCSPKQNLDYRLYSTFEIGFPSEEIEELLPYAENPSDPTETVYAMVPSSLVEDIIEKAGGIVGFEGSC